MRDSQPYELRNAEHFRIEIVSSSAIKRSLFYKGFQLYNSLTNNVKLKHNFNIYKKYIVFFFLVKLYIVRVVQLLLKSIFNTNKEIIIRCAMKNDRFENDKVVINLD